MLPRFEYILCAVMVMLINRKFKAEPMWLTFGLGFIFKSFGDEILASTLTLLGLLMLYEDCLKLKRYGK